MFGSSETALPEDLVTRRSHRNVHIPRSQLVWLISGQEHDDAAVQLPLSGKLPNRPGYARCQIPNNKMRLAWMKWDFLHCKRLIGYLIKFINSITLFFDASWRIMISNRLIGGLKANHSRHRVMS